MCLKDKEFRDDWKHIADEWKNKCLTHIITLTKVSEMVNHSDEVENTMDLIRAELVKTKFIKA